MRSDVRELIASVEGAAQGDVRLDLSITQALFPDVYKGLQRNPDCGPLLYTTSVDAALSLAPPDTYVELSGPRRYLEIPSPVPNRWRAELDCSAHPAWAATAPLAICLAALREIFPEETRDAG